MRHILQLLERYRTKQALLIVVIVLVGLNVVRYTLGHYAEQQEKIVENGALLEKYRIAVRDLDGLKARVAQQEKQKKRIDGYFFTGESEEEIASAIQIMLQEKISEAGLEVVSIRPVMQSVKSEEKKRDFQELVIKARLTGNLNDFVSFMADLYNSNKLMKIESFALHASRQKDLKIFLELKGFYRVA